jgi:hypothetical protein
MFENCRQLKKSKTLAPIVNALFASVMPGEHIDASAAEIHASESDPIASGGSLERPEAIGSIRWHRMQSLPTEATDSLPNCFLKPHRSQSLPVASERRHRFISLRNCFRKQLYRFQWLRKYSLQ